MTIAEILKSSALKDSLNESQVADIENAFNEAVELKAASIANDIITEKELELKESYEAKELELAESFKEHTDNFEQKITDKLDSFLESTLRDFIDESRDLLEAEVKARKSEAILAVFDNLIETAGVSAGEIVEKAQGNMGQDYNRICEKYDAIVEERQELKTELAALRNKVLIAEASEGLNLVEAEKFKRIAELLIEGEEDEEKAKEKLENLKASKDSKDSKDSDDDEDEDEDETPAKKKELKESKLNNRDWSRF